MNILFRLCFLTTVIVNVSCSGNKTDMPEASSVPIEGTWELLSETKIENGDTAYTEADNTRPMIKMINKTHFAFFRHDINQGKDSSALFVAGGGRYILSDDQYTEHLDYCNSREWENHTFQFTVNIASDTLIQSGTEKLEGLGIDRIIIEKYKRVDE